MLLPEACRERTFEFAETAYAGNGVMVGGFPMKCDICERMLPQEEVLEVQVFGEHDMICLQCLERLEVVRGKDHIKEGR